MKLGVCVPYRNREAHLAEFVPRVGKYLEDRGIDYCMYFAHQKDDKLFNRGAMKNIAAKFAFEEGCDYIVWHDIDMIPVEGGGADYSYPADHPRHIATNISQMDYKLKYFEYFGGAVVFTKEQVERTNGYSNDYWDWGSEDDDLFWRCHLEGMCDEKVFKSFSDEYFHFTGEDSYIRIPVATNPSLNRTIRQSHTIQILCRAEQQPEKVQIYLVGNPDRQYVEYPILCVPGYDYGINFNNSRAISLQFWNSFNQHNYIWAKRYDRQWTYVTATFDTEARQARLYINGREIDSEIGEGSCSPFEWVGRLKAYVTDWYLGTTTSVAASDPRRYFKGDIHSVFVWNRCLSPEEVKEAVDRNLFYSDLVFGLKGLSIEQGDVELNGVRTQKGEIKVVDSILPYRETGRFECLYHEDEGIVGGKFRKEKSKDNERRYLLQMQQGLLNYKNDGIAQVKYELLGIDQLAPKAKMINVAL